MVVMIRCVAIVDESLSIAAMIVMAIMSAKVMIMLIMIIIMSSLWAATVVVYAVVDYAYTHDQSRQ